MVGQAGMHAFGKPKYKKNDVGKGFGGVTRSYFLDPSISAINGKNSPGGIGYYRATAFWKNQYEVARAAGFGTGARKTSDIKSDFVSPDTYDPNYDAARKSTCYKGLTLKYNFKTGEELAKCGPGPAKYLPDVNAASGKRAPVYSMQFRPLDTRLFVVAAAQPSPDAYNTRLEPGATMPNITLKARAMAEEQKSFNKKPGPGAHDLKSFTDKYNTCPVPPNRDHIEKEAPHMNGWGYDSDEEWTFGYGKNYSNFSNIYDFIQGNREIDRLKREEELEELQEAWRKDPSMRMEQVYEDEVFEEDYDISRVVNANLSGIQRSVDLNPSAHDEWVQDIHAQFSRSGSERSGTE